MSALAVRSLAIAVALAAGAALFSETRHYALLGFDTYPLIVSSRVETPGDLVGLWSERLMDGRYPSAFHRPLVSASFALDEALWGLDPVGYQLTGALLFTGLLLALAALGERAGGERARWMAVVLPALIALHPSYYEIVPIPARRADLLCAGLAVASVALALSRRALGAGLVALLAIASKESGYAVPLLVGAAVFALGGDRSVRERARAAWHAAVPALAFAALALASRLVVLGGMGGHRDDLGPIDVWLRSPGIALQLAEGVALPGAASTPVARALLLAGLVLAATTLVLARRDASGPLVRRSLEIVGFGLVWLLVFSLTYAGAGWVGAWYYLLPAVGGALAGIGLLTALAALAADAARSSALRALAAVTAVLLGAVAAWQVSFAPMLRSYGEWQRASEVAGEFLGELDRRIARSGPGAVVDAPPLPMWASPREGVPGVAGAAILSDYSVQAWADLVHPDLDIRVLGVPEGLLPPGPPQARADELVVRIARRRVGY